MKAKLNIILIGIMAVCLFLGGCGNNVTSSNVNETNTENEANTENESDETSAENLEKEAEKQAAESTEITIYFARHGKTMLNTTDRSQGWIDAPLTPAGVEVAECLGKGLADLEFDKAYSSDSGRAIETAELVLSNNGQGNLEINKDKRFREYNFGTFEGMMNEEMRALVAEQMGMTEDEFMGSIATDGMAASLKDFSNTMAEMDKENVEEGVNWPAEDYNTIVSRLTEALDDIVKEAEKNGDNTILVISHGMSIITLLSELDPSAELPPTGLSNASISTVVYKDSAYTVTSVNDMSYVENGKKLSE